MKKEKEILKLIDELINKHKLQAQIDPQEYNKARHKVQWMVLEELKQKIKEK